MRVRRASTGVDDEPARIEQPVYSDVMWRGVAALLALTVTMAPALLAGQSPSKALSTFHSNPWLNLHHYARAMARGGPDPKELSGEERATWTAGIDFYKPYAARDLLADQGMIDIKNALRAGEGRSRLEGVAIDGDLRATLERLMPIYQKHWWPAHDRINREWIAAARPLVDRHGAEIARAVARVYDVTWPAEPVPVDVAWVLVQAAPIWPDHRAAAVVAFRALLHGRRADDTGAEGARGDRLRGDLDASQSVHADVRSRVPREDRRALGPGPRWQAVDSGGALVARRRVQVAWSVLSPVPRREDAVETRSSAPRRTPTLRRGREPPRVCRRTVGVS